MWKRITIYAKGVSIGSKHALTSEVNNRKRKVDNPIVVELHENFKILVGYGEVQATRFVREEMVRYLQDTMIMVRLIYHERQQRDPAIDYITKTLEMM